MTAIATNSLDQFVPLNTGTQIVYIIIIYVLQINVGKGAPSGILERFPSSYVKLLCNIQYRRGRGKNKYDV